MTCAKLRIHFIVVAFFLATTLLVAEDIKAKGPTNPTNAPGDRGTLRIKGISGHDSVFLNGTSQEFFVGKVDQFKDQGMVLPTGQQHVIIVDPEGNRQVYSAYVDVLSHQRAILRVDKSSITYEKWAGEGEAHALPQAGQTTAAIQPVSGKVTAYPSAVDCGQSARLVWNTNGYNTLLKLNGVAVGKGGTSGEQVVDPRETTTYQLETFGPGGVTMTPVTVTVNKAIKTSLSATPAVVRYQKLGDPGKATLNWSASNAQSVVLEPFGSVTGTSGERDITYTPGKGDLGRAPETRTYKITATNDCGGSDTTVAQLDVVYPPLPLPNDPPPCGLPPNLPCELPPTGSPLPLIGLLGVGSLASGLVLRRLRKK